MYEYGMRLSQELPGLQSLQKQVGLSYNIAEISEYTLHISS